MFTARDVSEVLSTAWRLLTFRAVRPDMARLGTLYLGMGLLFAWIAGVGRYWDNPRADLWQKLGLGSVVYVLVMAAILYAIVMPLKPRNWSYQGVLTFVALTSPPAFLYAIPVERFMPVEDAQGINVLFLGIIAAWRVALLILYLRRAAGLTRFEVLVGSLLPLALVVTILTILNLEHAVFEIMGGLDPESQTAKDAAYAVLLTITMLSVMAAPLLLAAYGYLIWRKRHPGPEASS